MSQTQENSWTLNKDLDAWAKEMGEDQQMDQNDKKWNYYSAEKGEKDEANGSGLLPNKEEAIAVCKLRVSIL